MTFTRMLDWFGGPPAEANAAFEAAFDAEPASVAVPAIMSKEEKRALLQRGIVARGEAPRVHA